eukprot:g34372.t1
MKREIHCLLKSRCITFKSDDPDLYRKSRYHLYEVIRDVKRQYQTKLETQTNHMDIRGLWQGLHAIMGNKVKQIRIVDKNAFLPDVPNALLCSVRTNGQCNGVACPDSPCYTSLISIIMKCFKRLVMAHSNSSLPACLDPLQFTYHHNRSMADTISLALHSSLEHLVSKDTSVRLLLIDYSSAFNTNFIQTSLQTQRLSKTKELVIDFRKQGRGHSPIYIHGAEEVMAESVEFLRVTITNDLSWLTHIDVMVKKTLPQEAKEIQH